MWAIFIHISTIPRNLSGYIYIYISTNCIDILLCYTVVIYNYILYFFFFFGPNKSHGYWTLHIFCWHNTGRLSLFLELRPNIILAADNLNNEHNACAAVTNIGILSKQVIYSWDNIIILCFILFKVLVDTIYLFVSRVLTDDIG